MKDGAKVDRANGLAFNAAWSPRAARYTGPGSRTVHRIPVGATLDGPSLAKAMLLWDETTNACDPLPSRMIRL